MDSSAAVSLPRQAPPREQDPPTQPTPEGWWKEWSSKANRIREDAACLSLGNCLSFYCCTDIGEPEDKTTIIGPGFDKNNNKAECKLVDVPEGDEFA